VIPHFLRRKALRNHDQTVEQLADSTLSFRDVCYACMRHALVVKPQEIGVVGNQYATLGMR